MSGPSPPERSHLGHQGIWGTRGEHASIEWYASSQDTAEVAAWYRAALTGYVESEPGSWIKRETIGTVRSFHHVLVGAAGSWPTGWPTPPEVAAGVTTLIMEATGMAPAADAPEAGRPPSGPSPRDGPDGPGPRRRGPVTRVLRAMFRRHR